ncbi:hypothetical protein T492DRAFT_908087 [Pavlovales sp. CCMP2436]|nr:hypothetical protein T492DRAFT_908087 [Pavlovales sp. CCMP2436]
MPLPQIVTCCLLIGAHVAPRAAMLPVRSVAVHRGRALASANERPSVDDEPSRRAETMFSADFARVGVLLTVPIAWGTYAPAVKIAYAAASEPAVPGLLLSAGQYLVAVLTLSAASALVGRPQPVVPVKSEHERDARVPLDRGTWLAGLELGSYLFVANLLQISGLVRLPTDRAAFLVQTTTLLVPLIDAAQRGGLNRLPARTWAACLLAFSGVVTMSGVSISGILAQLSGGAGVLPPTGDVLILGSALFYSMHVIRLSALAPGLDALQLAPRKAACELLLAAATLFTLTVLLPGLPLTLEIRAFAAEVLQLDGRALALLAGAAVWMGAVTTGYTMWAQSYGQGGKVSAPAASLIYTSQPLWSAAFAYALLGETLLPSEAAGGALVIGGVLLGATAPDPWAEAAATTGASAKRSGEDGDTPFP